MFLEGMEEMQTFTKKKNKAISYHSRRTPMRVVHKEDPGFRKESFATGSNRHSTILEREAQEQEQPKTKKREQKEQRKQDSKKAGIAESSKLLHGGV
jgi:hypothetical protein